MNLREEKRRENGPALTVVARDAVFKGNLNCKESICVAGRFEGDIQTEQLVWVEAQGRVKGNISARRVVNEGEISGDIYASEQVDVRSNGRVTGDISAARISVSQGCFFEGEAHLLR